MGASGKFKHDSTRGFLHLFSEALIQQKDVEPILLYPWNSFAFLPFDLVPSR